MTGGCQCGACRFEARTPSEWVHVCHCLECRRQSASAFGITVSVASAGFRLTKGAPRGWTRPTDKGGTVECWFCPDCGTRLYHLDPADTATVFLKGGALDDPPDLTGVRHIWTVRRMPGVLIPDGAAQYPGDPDDGGGMRTA